jgi:hypothetical protein
MKINVLAVVGLVIVVAFVVLGFIWDFKQAWMIEIVGAAAGLALVVTSGIEKQPTGSKWKGFLIGLGLSSGAMLAVIGGVQESVITTVIGAIVLIATVIIGVIKGQTE